jgi:hypothetical protein
MLQPSSAVQSPSCPWPRGQSQQRQMSLSLPLTHRVNVAICCSHHQRREALLVLSRSKPRAIRCLCLCLPLSHRVNVATCCGHHHRCEAPSGPCPRDQSQERSVVSISVSVSLTDSTSCCSHHQRREAPLVLGLEIKAKSNEQSLSHSPIQHRHMLQPSSAA